MYIRLLKILRIAEKKFVSKMSFYKGIPVTVCNSETILGSTIPLNKFSTLIHHGIQGLTSQTISHPCPCAL